MRRERALAYAFTYQCLHSRIKKLATTLMRDQSVETGPHSPDLLDKQLGFLTRVVLDTAPLGSNFGDCSTECFFPDQPAREMRKKTI
ncbi:hypothetical protein SOVF_075090 [Spinacia oleracea]|nr:hypothetical protein SOVF_075090 [Spinacia oleracea]